MTRLERQVKRLAQRISTLEHGELPPAPPAGEPGEAVVTYSGSGQFGPFRIRIARREQLATLLAAEPELITPVFAALSSPVRIALLRSLIDGPRTSQQLQEAVDTGSVGQLYHHLKELQSAGLVVQPRRSEYAIPQGKVVDVCVALATALHLSSTSHQYPPPPPS